MSRRSAIEAALEVARRPTTGQGERDAAIAGALRLIESAGLDPDDFDIPGRKRSKPQRPPPSAFRENLFSRPRSPFWNIRDISSAELQRELRGMTERMAREQERTMNDPAYMREVADFLRRQRREQEESDK